MNVGEKRLAITRPMVLVVDDDASVLQALSALLQARVEPLFHFETAASAEEAIELLNSASTESAQAPLALVVTDEKMPGKTGVDLLVALKAMPAHRDGGRVVLTGYADLASAKRAINEAEVDRYYPKPWDAAKLLPAVGTALARFARQRGLDRFLAASRVVDVNDLAVVRQIRREWWAYLTLADELLEAAGDAIAEPSFDEPEDTAAIHFVARRISPRDNDAAGCIRLWQDSEGQRWVLDALSLAPLEANDETEMLLLRTALMHASGAGIGEVHARVPTLRQALYANVGFQPVVPSGLEGQHGAEQPPEGAWWIAKVEQTRASQNANDDPVNAAFKQRFVQTGVLCSCHQRGCPERDYAAERRGYYCPLDVHEGRLPKGFPASI